MGRPSKSKRLTLWANGELVGTWSQPSRGTDELQYDEDWVESRLGRPISLSLPFLPGNVPIRGQVVENWFENLLPDATPLRERLARRFGVSSVKPFELLQAIGRDCVGAIQLMPDGEEPADVRQILASPLEDSAVERILARALGGVSLGPEERDPEDLRISIAGAQEKTALLQRDGRWYLPIGPTPTTHILKLPMGRLNGLEADFSTSVDNEWLCLRILNAYGLPVAPAEVARFGEKRVLVVKRFDRADAVGRRWIHRIPQEDFCQALGLPSNRKYESDNGPGLRHLFRVIAGSAAPDEDAYTLMMAQVLFWLLRATDGHAKNFSLRILPGGRYQLTPLYDVISFWPAIGRGPDKIDARRVKLAMSLRGTKPHRLMYDIQVRHFEGTAKAVGYPGDVRSMLEHVVQRAEGALEHALHDLPFDFSEHVLQTVTDGFRGAVEGLKRQLVAGAG